MLWHIDPKSSVGILKFGMNFDQITKFYGINYEQFKRTPQSDDVVTAFDSEGLHLIFDDKNTLKHVTVFAPNEAMLGPSQLLNRTLLEVMDDLTRDGLNFHPVDAGLWSEELGILLIDIEGKVDGVEIAGP